MQKPLSLSAKLLVLVALALLFGATMIALSIRSHPRTEGGYSAWNNSDKNIEKTFSVHPDGKLVIDADEGDISITGSDSEVVTVRVSARGSEDQIKKLSVNFDQQGEVVKAECRLKRGFLGFATGQSIDIHFDVRVPRSFNLHLRTSGGDIVIHDIKGRIQGETSGGDIDVSEADGNVSISTSGGDVRLVHSTGDLVFETSGGNIHGENVTGTIRLETSGGDIELKESDGKLYASTSGGDIRVALKDNKGIDLSSSGGNLVVDLPKSITAEVRAETSGGDVNCEFEFNGKLKEGSLKATINGGGNLIRLETSGGDIVINPVE